MKATAEFYDYFIVGASSKDNDYPPDNLKIYDSSTESYRSADTNETTIVIDLGSSVPDPHVILYNVNFTNYKVQGHFEDVWTSPDSESSDFTIQKDLDLGIYKHKVQLTGFNDRFLRIVIANQTPVDNASYFEIGVLGVFATLEDFEVYAGGFSPDVTVDKIFAEQLNRFLTNRKQIIQLSDKPVLQFGFSGNFQNSNENRDKLQKTFGDPSKNIIFIDRTNENNWEAYIVQRTGSMSMNEIVSGTKGVRRYAVTVETIL